MRLEELEVYNLAMEMGERVWVLVSEWDYFAKDTIGKQLVRAADSVAANLSEAKGSDASTIRRTNSLAITAEGLFTKHRRGLQKPIIDSSSVTQISRQLRRT